MKTLKKNIYLTLTCILVLSLNTLGQLKVASNGFVGVGTLTPLKQFHVAGGDALIQCATDKNFEIVNWDVSRNGCVTLNARNDLNNSHIPMSFASSCFYFHYGSVGIGRIPFFKLDVNGDIRVNTTIYTSDETLKSNIQPIKTQVDNLFRVKSVSYYFKDAQLTSANNSSKKSSDNITEEKDMRIHYGFIAQEVKEIYPELVYQDKDGILGIDYVSFIPLIIEKLKNQNEAIDNLKQEIASVKTININSLTSNNDRTLGELYQNYPNPFNKSTQIKFKLINNANTSWIYIYNLQGQQIKSYQINNAIEFIEIKASELTPGIYLYSLVVDSKLIDTKTMILTQ